MFVLLTAQVRHPRQLRKEILESQKTTQQNTKKSKSKSDDIARPFTPFSPLSPILSPLAQRGVTFVYIEHSDSGRIDKILHPDYQVLIGHVRFRHDNTVMFCDSAYYYSKANSLDAFGRVKIVQGDTLFVFSDFLFYDGNLKLAKFRKNVRMENRKTRLYTDSLNYDRIKNLAYYNTGGKITDQLNTLTSEWGQYSPSNNNSLFKQNVHLVNKNYYLDTDSLRYNTKTKIANLVCGTHIRYNDETDIYSSNGWYNTETERSMLLNRSKIIHKNGKTIVGDTLFYDKNEKYGEGFKHVEMTDSIQRTTLCGDYTYYDEKEKVGLATDSALLIDWSNKDTMFIHADSLYSLKDSIYNMARGYYNVRIYRNDLQATSDSLNYSARDSIINLYGKPVLWSDNNQLSGNQLKAYVKNKKINRIRIEEMAIAIQHQDSVYYNQMSGKEIIALIDSSQLKKVFVNGNAETVYYPIDSGDSTIVGLNHTESSHVTMYLRNKKVDKVVMTSATAGTMYPLEKLTDKELYLKNFLWSAKERPKNKLDLFTLYDNRKKVIPKKPSLEQSSIGILKKSKKEKKK